MQSKRTIETKRGKGVFADRKNEFDNYQYLAYHMVFRYNLRKTNRQLS